MTPTPTTSTATAPTSPAPSRPRRTTASGWPGSPPASRSCRSGCSTPPGSGPDWATAQALRFAADHGADVANLSLGAPLSSAVVDDAVAYARSRGVTIVAAAGNGDANGIGGPVSYPASAEGVISVGAVRYDLARAAYSNFGPSLDLVAPGGDLTVDQNADTYADGILQETFFGGNPADFGYGFLQGTSMAAPQVSAVAGPAHRPGRDRPRCRRAGAGGRRRRPRPRRA